MSNAELNGAANAPAAETSAGLDFIRQIVVDDLQAGRHNAIVTRFPPEPNGYCMWGT